MKQFISADVYTDKILGSSYKVVKEIYKNLDAIKLLADSSTVETLLNNYEQIKGVLDVSEDLLKISKNMDSINAASDYAAQAATAASKADDSSSNANKAQEKTASLLAQTKEVAEGVEKLEYYLTTVSSNLSSIQSVEENLHNIGVLAATLEDDNSAAALDELINNLTVIKNVAAKMETLETLSDKLLSKNTIDKLNTTLTNINAISDVCKENVSLMRAEVSNMDDRISSFSTLASQTKNELTDLTTTGAADLNQIKEDCQELLEQVKEYNDDAVTIREECNRILLKVRDLYHQFEETLGKAVHKAMLQIMQAGDGQVKRILGLGDTMVERIDQLADDATEAAEQQIQEAADKIVSEAEASMEETAQEKIQEVTEAADEKIKEITDTAEEKLEEINTTTEENLQKIEDAGDAKVEEIQQILIDTQYGDILWGYVDYSLPENQEEMEVGITYINAWDEDGYIQINKDTNAFERDPVYIRFYMKSATGNVSYLTKQVKFNLDEVLAASTTAKGIIEIATSDEVRAGEDYELAVTPGALKDALPDLLEDALPKASTDTAGIIETATATEVVEGTSTDVAVTPGALAEALPDILEDLLEANENGNTNTLVQTIVKTIVGDVHLVEELYNALSELLETTINETLDKIKSATTEYEGLVELATTEETREGTDTERAVTPSGLTNALPDILKDILKATDDGTTNTVVQEIVKTIVGDVHLVEELYDALYEQLADTVNAILDKIKTATTEYEGLVELATTEETKDASVTDRSVTPSGLINALPDLMQDVLEANADGTTNTVVQEIIKTIGSDVHLQEDLYDSLESYILELIQNNTALKLEYLDHTPAEEDDSDVVVGWLYAYPYNLAS